MHIKVHYIIFHCARIDREPHFHATDTSHVRYNNNNDNILL